MTQKLLWAGDELPLTPVHDLFELLSSCASRGMIVSFCTQDLSQIERVWGREAAEGALTFFGVTVVYEGIQNTRTLEIISTVLGQRWETINTFSHGLSAGDKSLNKSWNEGETHHRVPVLDPGEISRGHPDNPELVLAIRGDGWGYLYPLPYFKSAPWPELLVASMEYVRTQLSEADPRQWLPVPDLDRDGDGRYLRGRSHKPQLFETYRRARAWFEERRAKPVPTTPPAPPRPPAVIEMSFTASDSDQDITRTIQAAYDAWDQVAMPPSPPSTAPTTNSEAEGE